MRSIDYRDGRADMCPLIEPCASGSGDVDTAVAPSLEGVIGVQMRKLSSWAEIVTPGSVVDIISCTLEI